jgi:prepilin-type N-terminal cleavage/methylation domain-containing protein
MTQRGFTLIELIIFVIVIGLAGVILIPSTTNFSGAARGNTNLRALQLARGRMELILASKHINGFSSFTDPCTTGSPPSACTLPSGFSIATPTIASSWNANSDYKLITVAVSGSGAATLTAIVSNT